MRADREGTYPIVVYLIDAEVEKKDEVKEMVQL
jgi:hypothetical protein